MRNIPREVGVVTIEGKHLDHLLDALYAYGYIICKTSTSNRATVHLILSLPEEGEEYESCN